MKKLHELAKPFLAIILGALLFLSHLADLSAGGAALVLGIIWLVLGAFAMAAGILGIVLGSRLSSKTKEYFEVAIVAAYPTMLFVELLLTVIDSANLFNVFAWVLCIFGMIATLAFMGLFLFAYFKRNKNVIKLTFLFAALFALFLLITLLYTFNGNERTLGGITPVELATYATYIGIAFNVLPLLKSEPAPAPAPVEEPKEEKPAEEPKEEAAE